MRRPFEQRLELGLEWRDLFKEVGAIARLPVVVPGREQPSCEREAGLAELLLGGEPFAVGGEVPGQVRPAELALFGVEVVVGAPAIRAGDAGEVLAEQRLDLALMTAGGDPEDGRLCGQRAPERTPLAGCAPAGLVDVDGRSGADLLGKLGVRRCERRADTLHDRVDGAGRKLDAEQLAHELGAVAARDAVADCERRDAACSRGPKAPRGTSVGSPARVSAAQSGQRSRCRRCSVTVTAISGSSET